MRKAREAMHKMQQMKHVRSVSNGTETKPAVLEDCMSRWALRDVQGGGRGGAEWWRQGESRNATHLNADAHDHSVRLEGYRLPLGVLGQHGCHLTWSPHRQAQSADGLDKGSRVHRQGYRQQRNTTARETVVKPSCSRRCVKTPEAEAGTNKKTNSDKDHSDQERYCFLSQLAKRAMRASARIAIRRQRMARTHIRLIKSLDMKGKRIRPRTINGGVRWLAPPKLI